MYHVRAKLFKPIDRLQLLISVGLAHFSSYLLEVVRRITPLHYFAVDVSGKLSDWKPYASITSAMLNQQARLGAGRDTV